MKKISTYIVFLCIFIVIVYLFFGKILTKDVNLYTSSELIEDLSKISNQKICWGIKRSDNHNQPDVGDKNKKVMDEYNGLCMGGSESKQIYLTFDAGYEAGYTEKILDVLKENNVKAAFFITGHYLNTQPDIVKRMIEEGHIVGNHTPRYVMFGIKKI